MFCADFLVEFDDISANGIGVAGCKVKVSVVEAEYSPAKALCVECDCCDKAVETGSWSSPADNAENR